MHSNKMVDVLTVKYCQVCHELLACTFRTEVSFICLYLGVNSVLFTCSNIFMTAAATVVLFNIFLTTHFSDISKFFHQSSFLFRGNTHWGVLENQLISN